MQSILAKPVYQLIAAFLTVCLFYLAFPSGGYAAITWLVMIPLFVVLPYTQARSAFWLGLIAATLGWMASIWWVIDGLSQVLSSYHALITLLVFAFCLVAALPYALACFIHRFFNFGNSISGAVFSSATITCLVVFTPHLLPGNLVHSLYLSPLFIQTADIGSVGLVFFIIHFVSILLAYTINNINNDRSSALKATLIACGVFCLNSAYGYYKINATSEIAQQANTSLKVGIIQPNISIDSRTRKSWLENQETSLNFITAIRSKAEIIVMPEIPVPVSFEYFNADKKVLKEALGDSKHPAFFFTAIEPIDRHSIDDGYFNTIELIDDFKVTQRYRKQTLVPFAEYLPFEEQFPMLRELFPYAPKYQPGTQTQLLEIDHVNGPVNFLPLICYEAVFSKSVLTGVNKGADVLLNTVNDAWFGETAGARVHFSLSIFRTIESRTPLIRATNNGISAIVDSTGTLLKGSVIENGIGGISISEINVIEQITFYQRFPNAFKYLCIAMMLLGLIIPLTTNKDNVLD